MIVMARNPIDVLPSFAHLVNTGSHSLVPNEEYHVDFPEFWESWVTTMTQNLKENHERVLSELVSQMPTFFVRYEDLKLNPQPVLELLFCFLLDVGTLKGTLIEKRIQEVTATGFSSKNAYKLKNTSNNLCRSSHMYTEAQITTMES